MSEMQNGIFERGDRQKFLELIMYEVRGIMFGKK